MKFHGIQHIFRENNNGRVYGLTFIDNKNRAVFNGGDLGKGYSGQALIQKLDKDKISEKEAVGFERQLPPLREFEHEPRLDDWDIKSRMGSYKGGEVLSRGGYPQFKRRTKKKKKRRAL